jgi:DNA-binding CsgD family transcriptional regulator
MNTADLANERVFAEIKRLCLMGFDSTTLRQRFTERLSRAVPYEGYVAFTMDPSSGLITDALVEEMGNERTTRHFLEDVLFEDDILEFNWMVRNRLPVGLLSEATGGKLEHGEIGDLGVGWREGEGLPAPIWTVLGALKRALRPETDRELNSGPYLRVRGRSGRWLTLQASRTEPAHARSAESMVIIAPAGPKEVLRLTANGYGLSPREQEVVELAVRGASTKEISRALYISEYTVKDHLKNIFGKVGVRGRRALVKQLYLNTIFP